MRTVAFKENSIYIRDDMGGLASPLEGIQIGKLKLLIAYQIPHHYFEVDRLDFGMDSVLPKENFRCLSKSWIGIIQGNRKEIELHRENLTLHNPFIKNIFKKN